MGDQNGTVEDFAIIGKIFASQQLIQVGIESPAS